MKMKTAPKSRPSKDPYCTDSCPNTEVFRYRARSDDVLAKCSGCGWPGYVRKEKELEQDEDH